MPYIIHVPQITRPYITNNPVIFMDCHSWNWDVESRPYNDSFCRAVLRQEDARYESDHRVEQLEQFWMAEVERRKMLKNVEASMQATVMKTDASKEPAVVRVCGKHTKNDSVHDVVEFIERKEPAVETVELDT